MGDRNRVYLYFCLTNIMSAGIGNASTALEIVDFQGWIPERKGSIRLEIADFQGWIPERKGSKR